MRIRTITFIGLFFFIIGFSLRYIKNDIQHDCCKNCASREACLSQIIESDRLEEIKNHLRGNNILVVFDLDNTLIAPSCMAGSDPWFSHMVEKKRKEGYSYAEAVDLTLPIFQQLFERLSYYLVEPTIPQLLKYLRELHTSAIILTNRGAEQKEKLLKKVTEAGLPLPLTEFGDGEISAIFDVPMLYTHGIVFCGRNDKGAMLFHMLDTVHYRPSKIIFVDDKYHYLSSVERACFERKIPFVGIRYKRCDEMVAKFDPAVAEKEIKALLGPDDKVITETAS